MTRPFRAADFPNDKQRRAMLGQPSAEDERNKHVLEKAEQAEVVKILRANGFVVCSLSQSRATKQHPGLGDLWWFAPGRISAGWFEVKRPVGGVQSSSQQEFQELCYQCGTPYIIGGQQEAWELVRSLAGDRVDAGRVGREAMFPQTILLRPGVKFTDAQKEQIRQMVEMSEGAK